MLLCFITPHCLSNTGLPLVKESRPSPPRVFRCLECRVPFPITGPVLSIPDMTLVLICRCGYAASRGSHYRLSFLNLSALYQLLPKSFYKRTKLYRRTSLFLRQTWIFPQVLDSLSLEYFRVYSVIFFLKLVKSNHHILYDYA